MAVQVRVWSPGAEIPIYNIVTHTWPSFHKHLPQFINKSRWKYMVTQYKNFKINLSLLFYVKSILENLEVLKTAIFVLLGTLNFVNLDISVFLKCKK